MFKLFVERTSLLRSRKSLISLGLVLVTSGNALATTEIAGAAQAVTSAHTVTQSTLRISAKPTTGEARVWIQLHTIGNVVVPSTLARAGLGIIVGQCTDVAFPVALFWATQTQTGVAGCVALNAQISTYVWRVGNTFTLKWNTLVVTKSVAMPTQNLCAGAHSVDYNGAKPAPVILSTANRTCSGTTSNSALYAIPSNSVYGSLPGSTVSNYTSQYFGQ